MRAAGAERRRASRLEVVAVVAAALVASVALNWPLVRDIDHRVHDAFDTLFTAWILDWAQHALTTDAPLWDANIFAPNPRTLAYSDALVGLGVVLLPFRWLGLTAIGVLNVGLLLAFASSAAAGYAFARVVTGRPAVAAVTGAAFGFGPANTFLAQHLNIALHPAPALAAAAVWALADRRAVGRRTTVPLVALAVTLALQGTVSFNTLAITVLAAAAVGLARWRDLGLAGLGQGLLAAAVGLVPVVPFALPYARNRSADLGPLSFDLGDFATSGGNFTTVDPSLALWGDALGSPTGLFGQQPNFPGVVLLGLAVVGALLVRRAVDRRVHVVAFVLVVVGAVTSMGTSDTGWARFAPYRLVVELVPGGTALRATGRFWLVGLLGLGLLAGLAVQHLVDRLGRDGDPIRRVAAVGLAAAAALGILGEGVRSWASSPRVEVPAVDRALADRPERGGVVYLPLPASGGLLDLLPQAAVAHRTTAHHRRTPNGYASYFPDSFLSLRSRLADARGEELVALLRELDVRFVVVGRSTELERQVGPGAASRLRFLGDYEGASLYELAEA